MARRLKIFKLWIGCGCQWLYWGPRQELICYRYQETSRAIEKICSSEWQLIGCEMKPCFCLLTLYIERLGTYLPLKQSTIFRMKPSLQAEQRPLSSNPIKWHICWNHFKKSEAHELDRIQRNSRRTKRIIFPKRCPFRLGISSKIRALRCSRRAPNCESVKSEGKPRASFSDRLQGYAKLLCIFRVR